MYDPLKVFLVEDEVLLQMQLDLYLQDAGHRVVGYASSAQEASKRISETEVDLAFVDIHLTDGPTGLHVGRELATRKIPFVFVTANARRIPDDFCGAIGVIGKPYSQSGIGEAINFLLSAIRCPPPPPPVPPSLVLATNIKEEWNLSP